VVLGDGQTTTLERIDPRLSRIPLYRFYPGNELNADYSNWFSPNRRAIEAGLRTAGFAPTLLSEWGDRVTYKAEKLEGVPEYLQERTRACSSGAPTAWCETPFRARPARPGGVSPRQLRD
jgi:hypothetical protein